MIKCVIIDDEPLAREGLVNYINEVNFLSLVGQGANPLELNEILAKAEVDLVFLDIQMPVINGIDFLKITKSLPMVIMTTAYPSFALESFDLDVLDYLLKPITFNRFLKAVHKAQKLHQLTKSQESTLPKSTERPFFFLKSDGKYERIYHDSILFIEGLQNYVTFHTKEGKYVALMTLKSVMNNLPEQQFMKAHRSYVISLNNVDGFEGNELIFGEQRIPMSRNYRKEVMDRVLGKNLWKPDDKD